MTDNDTNLLLDIMTKITDIDQNINLLKNDDHIHIQADLTKHLLIINMHLNKINSILSNLLPDPDKYTQFMKEEQKQRTIINKLYPVFYHLHSQNIDHIHDDQILN